MKGGYRHHPRFGARIIDCSRGLRFTAHDR